MRQLTASQKKIIRDWVKKKRHAQKSDIMHQTDFPSDPANSMIQDGTYDRLEKINDTEILYTEINRFANDYYSESQDKDGGW
jgi:hypothetical protein